MLKSDPATWTDPRHREGVRAERIAADLMRGHGYQILEHRYRFHRHDVDLVARKGSTVVFAEVKARASDRFGAPAQAVGGQKQACLVRAAMAWLQRHGRPDDSARFDVIAIQGDRVEWLQAAFRPGWR